MSGNQKDRLDPNGDPFDVPELVDITSAPWCRCCPGFCTMPVVTMICVILGFLFGVLGSNGDWGDSFKQCYADPKDSKMSGCWPILFKYPGDIWLTAIKLCITPLIAPMIFLLPNKINALGPLGKQVAVLLVFTSSIAALEGLTWVSIFQPGNVVSETSSAGEASIDANRDPEVRNVSEMDVLLAIPKKFVPKSIFESLAGSDVIGMVVFFLVWGYYFDKCPREWKMPAYGAAKAFLRATINVLCLIMWATPIGMFSFVSYNLMKYDKLGDIMKTIGKYVACQLTAQFFHLFGFYFLFFFLMTGSNPLQFLNRIKMAPFTALVLSSSAGTLPVTVAENLKEKDADDAIGRKVVEFVTSLGATINMDGTSCGFPVMVMWVDQMGRHMTPDRCISATHAYVENFDNAGAFTGYSKLGLDANGVDLGYATKPDDACTYYTPGMNGGDMLMVCLLAMMSSIGTAPIPNAGLVYVVMLMEAGGIENVELQSFGLGLIYMFDWLVDRVETAQNVTSDSFISKILAHHASGGKNVMGTSQVCCFSDLPKQFAEYNAQSNGNPAVTTGDDDV